MDYKNYTINDFIEDESFRQWVHMPDPGSDAYWMKVLNGHPHLKGAMDEAKQFLLLFNFRESDVLDTRISNLKKRIDLVIDGDEIPVLESGSAHLFVPEEKKIKKSFLLYKIAASVSILLIISYFVFYHQPFGRILSSQNQEITEKGNRTVITLEDGTRVWLNADSKLSYAENFQGLAIREVFLDGEAFFDVTEDPNKPFVVHTSTIRIRVLGTSFNVRSYRKDDQIRTTLVKGKVVIESDEDKSEQITLLPNQQAVFEKRSKKITLQNEVDTEHFTSWREGKLSFDEQPLSVIIDELQRWYNVSIKVEDESSLSCKFSAKINNKTLEEVLELFKASDGIDYTITGKEVFIKGKLCDE